MAKNFGKSPAAKRFDEVAKSSIANTNTAVIKLIENSALADYPNNGEDISYTADIEKSISELGFTDPIEVTDFGMAGGKYMIVSGHRRRAAGIKCGMDLFPCIIKSFANESDVQNYVLLANSHRDSAKDPLLYSVRYKMHEDHLKSINFQGSVREEIAERLGISVQQADRYNQMNKIILPVWNLVREDIVGMSSVLPMATLSLEEQKEIFEILKERSLNDIELTREKVKEIIKDYRTKSKSPHGEDRLKNAKNSNIQSLQSINLCLQKIGEFEFKDKEEAKNILAEMEKVFDTFKNIIEVLTVRTWEDKS
ncbi:MAG: ParB/RepB/Spo0J family partition protein [Treponema sp.]|nr:ParB/RepB/Spo0J family partition protein [Treponema sp.]